MIPTILTLVSLAAAAVALIFAVLACAPVGTARSTLAWASSVCGVLGLAAAASAGSIQPLDLAAVAGVVLVGGVAGAGWSPRGRWLLLALGAAGLAAVLYARLVAFGQLVDPGAILGQLSWGVARSSGFVAFLSATGAVVLGSRRPSGLPIGGLPARVYALHRALGISAVVALCVHLFALWTDDFVQFTPAQLLFLPWTSEYEPFAVTLGWLAMISLVLTAASGGLRRLLPGWRIVHALAYLTFALGAFHGLLAGSDSGSLWALGLYAACVVLVIWTLSRRFGRRPSGPARGGRRWWSARDLSPEPGTPTRAQTSTTARARSGSRYAARPGPLEEITGAERPGAWKG